MEAKTVTSRANNKFDPPTCDITPMRPGEDSGGGDGADVVSSIIITASGFAP